MLPNNYCNITEYVDGDKPGNSICSGMLDTNYIDGEISKLNRETKSS